MLLLWHVKQVLHPEVQNTVSSIHLIQEQEKTLIY